MVEKAGVDALRKEKHALKATISGFKKLEPIDEHIAVLERYLEVSRALRAALEENGQVQDDEWKTDLRREYTTTKLKLQRAMAEGRTAEVQSLQARYAELKNVMEGGRKSRPSQPRPSSDARTGTTTAGDAPAEGGADVPRGRAEEVPTEGNIDVTTAVDGPAEGKAAAPATADVPAGGGAAGVRNCGGTSDPDPDVPSGNAPLKEAAGAPAETPVVVVAAVEVEGNGVAAVVPVGEAPANAVVAGVTAPDPAAKAPAAPGSPAATTTPKKRKPVPKINIMKPAVAETPVVDNEGKLWLAADKGEAGKGRNDTRAVVTKEGFHFVTSGGEPQPAVPAHLAGRPKDFGEVMHGVSSEDLDREHMELLGMGQFGKVYRVRHSVTDEEYALKEILVPVGFSTSAVAARTNLLRELRLLNECKSPFVVEFKGCFFLDEKLSLVLEYMDAGSLRDILDSAHTCPEIVVLQVTGCVLRALTYIKSFLNATHRDIKPDNVLVNRRGEFKLCDFGISTFMDGSLDEMTRCGTLMYLAPERVDPNCTSYGIGADVWSLGIMLIELATGLHPYKKKATDREGWGLLSQILKDRAPALSRKRFSEELCHFVDLCLIKDHKARPSPQELLTHKFVIPLLLCDSKSIVEEGAQWVCAVLDGTAKGESPSDPSSM